MKYKELRIIRYKSIQDFKIEYNKRISDYSTIKTNLSIFPFGHFTRITDKKYNLFVVNNKELIMLQEQIHTNAFQINKMLSNLPDVAKKSFVISVLIDEIQSTNEIEGVHSSRKEIQDALNNMNKSKEKSRFSGIATLYYYLFKEKEFSPIASCEEIRKIYDELVSDEVEDNNILDGILFRKDPVEIKDGEKVIHRGNPDEESILIDMKKFIEFINSTEYPYLIKTLLSHYFFEYIHPFYDGNGRTGRYITCKYLSERLDPLTALSFSHMINDKKERYYKAFSITSEEYNMGEGTMFVYEMLKIVLKGQHELIKNLSNSIMLLEKAEHYIEKNFSNKDPKITNIIFLIIQSTLFNGNLLDSEIATYVDLHRSTVDSRLKELRQEGIINRIQKKPSLHKLSFEIQNEIHNS